MKTDYKTAQEVHETVREEADWLEHTIRRAHKGTKAELRAMIDRRKAILAEIETGINNVEITIPDEAAEYIKKEDTEKA